MENTRLGRMKKKISLLFLITLLFITFFGSVFGAEKKQHTLQRALDIPTVFKLLEKQSELDGQLITFQGELIGQAVFEKNGVFVNLMDKEFNALGIYMDKSLVKKFTHYGRYGTIGDYVKVSGIFHKVCIQHGGDTDLHASEMTILQTGKTVPPRHVPPIEIVLSILLAIVAVFLFLNHKNKEH